LIDFAAFIARCLMLPFRYVDLPLLRCCLLMPPLRYVAADAAARYAITLIYVATMFSPR